MCLGRHARVCCRCIGQSRRLTRHRRVMHFVVTAIGLRFRRPYRCRRGCRSRCRCRRRCRCRLRLGSARHYVAFVLGLRSYCQRHQNQKRTSRNLERNSLLHGFSMKASAADSRHSVQNLSTNVDTPAALKPLVNPASPYQPWVPLSSSCRMNRRCSSSIHP